MIHPYRGQALRQVIRHSRGWTNALHGVLICPFIPWTLGRRPDWLTKNVGDWWKEDVWRRK
jgi:hypothetical protein